METESLRLDFQGLPPYLARLAHTWKSSLRDSISMSVPNGNSATSELVQAYKPSLKDSILKAKIKSLRLEMLVTYNVSKQSLLTRWLQF